MRTLHVIAMMLGLGLSARALMAQGQGQLDLPRLTGPIRLDGVLDDDAWRAIPALPLTMYEPVFRGAPSESTVIKVAYDGTYLYASGYFHDSHPDQLRINSLYRDRYSGDDVFAIFLDPYNDNENGDWFHVNPAGTRVDYAISGDGASSDVSWNVPWDVATRVTPDGWTMELRIPFSSLRFQARDGRVVMGLAVTRYMARQNERVTFPAVDPRLSFRQPSTYQDMVLRDIAPSHPVYLTPYALGGLDRTPDSTTAVHEAGADLKYALSDNLNLNLSVNTDFAQVEADDQQINLTRFPTFFPEKRQFFQERAGVFAFDFGSGGKLFHSRRIGLTDDNHPIRILGGARVVGRTGGWDIGMLDMQTARSDSVPTENQGVFRLRRRIFNQNSYAGGILTSRLGPNGQYNEAAGIDGVVRVFGSDYFTFRGASTFDNQLTGAGLMDRSQVYGRYERRGTNGLTYAAEYNRIGGQFEPDLGFLPRQNETRGMLYIQDNFLLHHSGTFRSHGPGAIVYGWFRNSDHRLESAYGAYWWLYEFKNGANGFLEFIHNYEDVQGAFDLGRGVMVQPGIYRFLTVWFNYTAAIGPKLRTDFDARVGGFYDGFNTQLRWDPVWNVSRHLELGGSYQLDRIRFADRHTGLDVHAAEARVGVAASAKLSVTTIAQYNSIDQRLGINLRMRYNLREGRDVWLVWDEGLNTARDPSTPGTARLPLSQARALRLKVTWTTAL